MSSHRIPPGELSNRIAKLRDKVSATLKAREERLSKEKGPQLPSFTKKIKEEKDHEHSMARSELHKIDNAIKTLRKKLKGEGNLEAWVQSKITRAADYLDAASNYVDSGEHNGQVDESFDDVPEMRSRTVTDSPSSTSSSRKGRKSPGELMRMLNQDISKSKKKKKKDMTEETMTPEDKAKEKKLKKKYDASDMKQNMIDQYGEEKGTQIYFAKIRKMAMGEEVEDIQELAPLVAGGLAAGAAALGAAAVHRAKKSVDSGVNAAKTGAKVKPSSGLAGVSYNLQKRNQMLDQLRNQFDEFEGETLEERKLSRTAKRAARAGKPGYDAEGKPKPKGKVRAWDMDETLMRNDPKKIRVHVKDKSTGKTTRSLTNQEFNTDKLNKDKEEYDFGEFRSSEKFSKASKPNKSMVKKLKKQVRRGKPVHIVTARGSFDDQPKFAKHLRRHGIEIDKGKGKGGRHVHVHRAGDMPGSDIGEKKVKIVKGLMKKHGTSGAEMYDDAAKVHRAFKKSAKENPTQPKVKTKMVQPNKKDTTQARSFKEEIDLDLIYDFILEQLVLEEIVESLEDAASLVEEFSDELLEDLIQESYEMIESILTEEEDEEVEMVEEKELKIDYVSPYKKLQEKREIKEKYMVEETEMTPYEYWKSFIGDDEEISEEVVSEEVVEEVVEEETSMNSYQRWKKLLETK